MSKKKSTTETGLEPQTKEVQVIRKEKASSHVPIEIRQNAIHRLGSVYYKGGTHKGVPADLEKKLLPLVNDIPADSAEFRKASKDFWRSITVKVPSEGAVLNISIDEEGYPTVPKDYLTYLWAETHPEVAKTRSEMERFGKKKFYIHDPERESSQENDKVKAKAKAYKVFVKVLDDEEAIDRVLRVLGTGNPNKLSSQQKENALHKQMEASPARFYEVATDESLKTKDFIAKLIENEVLRKAGNSYFYIDELIGENLEEAVGFVNNPKHSKEVNDMKAKLEDRKQITPA
jgi:nucleoid-associated protein YgaU